MPTLIDVSSQTELEILIQKPVENPKMHTRELLVMPSPIWQLVFDYLAPDEFLSIVNTPEGVDFLLNIYPIDLINQYRINLLARSASDSINLYMKQSIDKHSWAAYLCFLCSLIIFAGIVIPSIYYASFEHPLIEAMVYTFSGVSLIFWISSVLAYAHNHHNAVTLKVKSSVINSLPELLIADQWILNKLQSDKKRLHVVQLELNEIRFSDFQQAREKFGLFQKSVDPRAKEPEYSIPNCLKLVCASYGDFDFSR